MLRHISSSVSILGFLLIFFLECWVICITADNNNNHICKERSWCKQTPMTTEEGSSPMSAFVIGGTGLVGRKLVAELAQSHLFQRIVTVGRRPVPYDGPGKEKLEQHVVDFDKIDENKDLFADIDVGFNTLGTTRADAGSAENFVKIDHDIPLHVARLFKEANPSKPTHFCLLTSAGSSATSSFLYPRTKGLLEKHITELGFTHVSIFRPAMLLHDGEKREKPRMVEGIFGIICKALNPLTGGRAGSGISTVAKAMTKVAEKGIGADASSQTTVDVYDNRQIIKLAEEQ
ncbi:unnamed protein product [Sphagnum compactum]